MNELPKPSTDPTPIFEHFRGTHGTELLVAATCHFGLFDKLSDCPIARNELKEALEMAERPFVVLTTALRAMGLLEPDAEGCFIATPLALEHLPSNAPFAVNNYLGLAADSPNVLAMVERLRTNKPVGSGTDEGAAFIFKDGEKSKMEEAEEARRLTLSLAGRANNVAPHLAANYPLPSTKTLLDVAGGSGIYAIAYLRAHPDLRAIVFDRPEVLKVAEEFAEEHQVADRLQLMEGDMFADPLPSCDAALLSNVLHDWDLPECETIVRRCADAVNPGGEVLIHDVFLNDDLSGPLPIALYSAALFSLTEGRAYSAKEYREMLAKAGLQSGKVTPTLVHCGVLPGRKNP
ncbi:MAG: methyltransferase [Verrucomicrobia bacterium]|jgi:ubiquinone/menaquinone biosynthesis C-methylase UbiE|nr:methyltransferase [Verrucomicrobiota bacterium]